MAAAATTATDNNVGPAIGAGVLGLATGAIIGGALAQPRATARYYEPGYQTYYEPGYTGTVVQASPGADVAYCIAPLPAATIPAAGPISAMTA